MKEAALHWHDQGFSVIPIVPKDKSTYESWAAYQNEQPSRDLVKSWWEKYPNAYIGLACGMNGLLVVDIDVKGEKNTQKKKIADSICNTFINHIPVVESPSGGYHLYFCAPHIPESLTQLKLKWNGIHIGEIQGWRHLVVAPPSPGYEPKNDVDIHEVPSDINPGAYLEQLLQQFNIKVSDTPSGSDAVSEDGRMLLEGTRDDWLIRYAGWLRAEGWDDDAIRTMTESTKNVLLEEGRVENPKTFEQEKDYAKSVTNWKQGTRLVEEGLGRTAYPEESMYEKLGAAMSVEEVIEHGKELSERKSLPILGQEGFMHADGLSVFAGEDKSGKSTLLRQLVREDWSGYRVLWLAEESITDWYHDYFQRVDDPLVQYANLTLAFYDDINQKITPKLIAEMIESCPQDIIVLDTTKAWFDMDDRNNESDVNKALQPILKATHRSQKKVILVHHFGKNTFASNKHRIIGSHAWTAVPDSYVTMAKQQSEDEEDEKRELAAGGRGINPESIYIEPVDKESHAFRVLGSANQVRALDKEMKVLEQLSHDRWATTTEITEALRGEITIRHVRRILQNLAQDGRIMRDPDISEGANAQKKKQWKLSSVQSRTFWGTQGSQKNVRENNDYIKERTEKLWKTDVRGKMSAKSNNEEENKEEVNPVDNSQGYDVSLDRILGLDSKGGV